MVVIRCCFIFQNSTSLSLSLPFSRAIRPCFLLRLLVKRVWRLQVPKISGAGIATTTSTPIFSARLPSQGLRVKSYDIACLQTLNHQCVTVALVEDVLNGTDTSIYDTV